ncbi:regulatory factor X 4-like [Liolophura sinensis]|uniref:regulatory factor X 4-like n=1 Tax=Liolophura sinensis TaxID=3198878 RepID=UPI003158889A
MDINSDDDDTDGDDEGDDNDEYDDGGGGGGGDDDDDDTTATMTVVVVVGILVVVVVVAVAVVVVRIYRAMVVTAMFISMCRLLWSCLSASVEDWLDQCFDSSKSPEDMEEEKYQPTFTEVDELSTVDLKRRKASRPHSTPLTLKWLEENYELAEGVCIPRSTLYYHYLDYCERNDTQPVNAASFGKIIRQQFPQITTRRLGTRGQSKYHYYGIGVRESSPYYDLVYSAKGAQLSCDGKKDPVKQIVAYSPRSKLGTLLPDFPELKDIKLPANIEESKVVTFLMMYRAHCQRILDTVIRANFDEVQSFLLHFWQGMPQHIIPILDSQTIATLVGVCDSVLYKAIASVLMPTVFQPLPDSLTQVIRRFAKQLDEWLRTALQGLPAKLIKIKFDLARRFAQVLRRQTSLNHLCVAARSVIHNAEITSQMLDDWLNIDLSSIVKQTLYTMDQYSEKDHQIIFNLCKELEQLFEDQAPIESYIAWLDSMVDRCVASPSNRRPGILRKLARQFLLMWSCFGTRVIRDMTLYSAPSFGSFHLLHLMFDEYVLYLVENLHSQERTREYLAVIKGEVTDASDEVVLPNPVLSKDSFGVKTSLSLDTGTDRVCMERSTVITNGRDHPLSGASFAPMCPTRFDDVYSNNSSPKSSVSSYSPEATPNTDFGQPPVLNDHKAGHGSCEQRFDNYGYSYFGGVTSGPQDCQAGYTYAFPINTPQYSSGGSSDGRTTVSTTSAEWASEIPRYCSSAQTEQSRSEMGSTSSCLSPGSSDFNYPVYDYGSYPGQHYPLHTQNGHASGYQGFGGPVVDCHQFAISQDNQKRKQSVSEAVSSATASYKRHKTSDDVFDYIPSVTYT